MNAILAKIFELIISTLFKGIFDYIADRRQDRNIEQIGVEKAEKENAIKVAKRSDRILKAAAKRRTNSDTVSSMRDGTF